ncbi:MAG: tryptophan--tRNA ligase [Microgenomates group bacterium]
MISPDVKNYSEQLEKLGIEHSLLEHPQLIEVEDVQKYLGSTLAEAGATIIMKAGDSFVAIMRRGDCKLDFKKIKKALQVTNLRVATTEEFTNITNVPAGAAHVFYPTLRTLIDEKIFETEYINAGSGSLTCTFRYKTSDLKKLPTAEIVDISETTPNVPQKKLKDSYSILTGITPSGSGEVHIGNYLGAVVPFLELQKKADTVYFFIADLHALTTVQNKEEMQRNVENLVLSYLAFGIDTEKVVFYRQSDIPQHTELQSILNNVTPLSLIKRAHAYKDKLQKGADPEEINMGLFSYPVLMAADILLYDPDYVPVGDDQKQHIEITRDIAGFFNKTYGNAFILPDIYNIKESARLVGTDGKRKMSKSLNNYIAVFADEKIIKKQVMSCFTDPNRKKITDPGEVEGNPVFTYHRLLNDNKDEVADLENRYKLGTVSDIEVKEKLLQAILLKFKKERALYNELKTHPEKIKNILKEGATKARTQAIKKMIEIREKIGITNKYSQFNY